jgi:hypothetical protein
MDLNPTNLTLEKWSSIGKKCSGNAWEALWKENIRKIEVTSPASVIKL